MDTSVLQKFLDEGMLDIGDDDSRFDALAKTSEALFEKLTDDFGALAQYTLVALDPDISPEEPALQQVEELAKEYWKTIRNRSSDRLRQILRAVILNTLANFTDQHPKHVAIVWLMASSYFSFVRHTHQESSVEHGVITKAGAIVEKEAAFGWAAAPVLDFSDFDLAKLKLAKLA
ncbi:MAG TPA: GTPase-associated system all-helical protein GASH, partial [Caldilineaceae bacterium]|nr:GTPase-associated system all-helical protein GASH [Caldilineaceae bacterium]